MQDFLSIIFDDLHLTDAEYFFVSASSDWAFGVNLPNRSIFHAVLQGEAMVVVGDERYHLSAGDLLIVPTGSEHSIHAPEGIAYPVVDISEEFGRPRETPITLGNGPLSAFILTAGCRFDVELGQPLMSALPAAISILGVQKSTPEWLRIGIEFLLQETRERRPGHQSILNRLGDIWFVEVLRTYIESLPEGNDSWLRALKDPALAMVLSAIHKHPGKAWTVPALAQMACLSRSAFADRFQKIMGKPPLTYVSEHRMRVAAWQLRHTGQPICHIGDAVGYASETAFGQAFKRTYGLAPGRYREQIRAESAVSSD